MVPLLDKFSGAANKFIIFYEAGLVNLQLAILVVDIGNQHIGFLKLPMRCENFRMFWMSWVERTDRES